MLFADPRMLDASLRDLRNAFVDLGRKVELKIAREAVALGSEIIAEAARARAPRDDGAYAASLRAAKPRYSKRRGAVIAGFGIDRAMLYKLGKGRRPANIWALLEFGHVKAGGGFVAARPHIRPALAAYGQTAMRAMLRLMRDRVAEAARRKAKRRR